MTYSKVKISGIIELKSGLHIGTSNAFAAIGATNNPIIKDPLTNLPYIPGSTLKGKMRSLLYRTDYNSNTTEKLSKDSLEISRLFGNSETYKIGRLVFRDAFLNNKEELGKRELVLSHLSKGVMVFNNELEDSAKKHANLSYESSSSLSQSQDYLSDAVERYGNDATYLLAGQADDVNAMTKFLEDKGIDKKKIKTSRFRGLK